MADDSTDFTFPSAVRGFHHYQRVWLPLIGQRLSGERELHNPEDRFAVAAIARSRPPYTTALSSHQCVPSSAVYLVGALVFSSLEVKVDAEPRTVASRLQKTKLKPVDS